MFERLLVDLSEAFDGVDHVVLAERLRKLFFAEKIRACALMLDPYLKLNKLRRLNYSV
jgi:hypothetical protein